MAASSFRPETGPAQVFSKLSIRVLRALASHAAPPRQRTPPWVAFRLMAHYPVHPSNRQAAWALALVFDNSTRRIFSPVSVLPIARLEIARPSYAADWAFSPCTPYDNSRSPR